MGSSRALLTKERVLVVEETSEWRYNIHNAIRSIGYRMVEGVPTIRDALDKMESEPFGWLFLSLNPADNPNLFHILEMITTYPELRHLKVSAFVKQQDSLYLKQAFEMGLMSYHNFAFSKEELTQSMTTLNERLTAHKWDSTFTSCEYLRDFLKAMEEHSALVDFERNLIRFNPSHPDILVNLAEAHALNKDMELCAKALKQSILIDPSNEERAEVVRSNLLKKDLSEFGDGTINLFDIKTALVVDSDEITQNNYIKILKKIGCEKIVTCMDGEEALQKIIGAAPDIIISEWKLPKINGPFFVQRIREKGLITIPIMIVSSLVSDQDRNLMREMGISNVVPKPLIENSFIKALSWVMQQERIPTDSSILEHRVSVLASNRKFKEAARLISDCQSNSNVNEGSICYMRAEIYYAQKKYKEAKNYLIKAVQLGHHSTRVYNLTGKTLMKLDDVTTALKCYEKADKLAPYNIVRLCAMAEAQESSGESSLANQTMSLIKSLDPRNQKVLVTEANFSLTRGAINKAKRILSEMDNLNEVFTFLNNKGVALAKRGKVNESISFYEKAMLAIPEESVEIVEAIQYNFALAQVRMKKYKEVTKVLKDLKKANSSRIAKKSEQLLAKVEKAIKDGTEIVLDTQKQEEVEEAVDIDQVQERLSNFKIVPPDPGDICCHLIYIDKTPDSTKRYTITGLPRFRTHTSVSAQKSA